MEIIGESAHRVLTYIEAMHRQGCPLTAWQVDAYAGGWNPKRTITGFSAFQLSMESRNGPDERDVVTEKMTDYLIRVGWAANRDGDIIVPTKVGLAVLREANSPKPGSHAGSTLEVVIDPKNPFAYAQLMSKIAGFEECMIVDPYLDQDQLLTLATFPSVTRILTSTYNSKKKAPAFGVVLASASASHLQLRMVELKLLHDRIVIPSDGSALMLGSSLNSIASRFGVATPLEESSTRLIRTHYDEMWATGTAVEPAKPEVAGLATASTVNPVTGD